jgi:hypothetical protein
MPKVLRAQADAKPELGTARVTWASAAGIGNASHAILPEAKLLEATKTVARGER